ncbi:MAG: DUF4231 domain-containing protein [Desulfobacteraceae bacterium]|nr:DUF4231 domain-containing protein [Desulfobacteraceae bacterium]
MDAEDFQKYLKERYEDQIDWYDKKSVWNQKVYRRFQWCVIVLSAITPVLVAIEATRWPAVVVSALVAIGTTALKAFKYQENWINYRTTCETLRKEAYFYNACIGDYRDSEVREALFVERVESLISRENTMWLTTQQLRTEKRKSEN